MAVFAAITVLIFIVFVIIVVFRREFVYKKKIQDYPSKFPTDKEKLTDREWFDVAIVGAGPGGATAAFFLAKMGWKCLLLEKKKFPRDKYCGDACCKTAIEILMEMGVYEELIKENKAHVSDSGGMCSPGGLSYIGRSKEGYGDIPAAIACKRILLDEAIDMAAKRMGAELKENHPVSDALFDKGTNLWQINIENSDLSYKSRVLICADGAPSRLATKLGIVTRAPDSSCARSYVEGGTHKFKADGVVFYNKEFLPASLRLGGEKCSYDHHCLVVGDSAGMTDPLTGRCFFVS